MTDKQHSETGPLEPPTSDTAQEDDVQGFGGPVGGNPSFIVQPFVGPAGAGGEFRTIVQPFASRPSGTGDFGVGVQPFCGRGGKGGHV